MGREEKQVVLSTPALEKQRADAVKIKQQEQLIEEQAAHIERLTERLRTAEHRIELYELQEEEDS